MTASFAAPQRGDIPHLRIPTGPEHFRRRAARLAALAPGHAAGDYLVFLSGIAAAQAQAWGRVPVPEAEVAIRAQPRAGVWRQALEAVLAGVNLAPAPAATHAAVARLRLLANPELDALADRVRLGELEEEDAALAPFVGAALQVVHTSIAARLAVESVPRSPDGWCPVCGSPPVAGVVLPDGGLRYLACSMCGSEWHRTRVQCVGCGEGGGLTYFVIEPEYPAVRAEACSRCRTYLKLFYLERDPLADPFADDIATLALDLRVVAEGYARAGVSCFWT